MDYKETDVVWVKLARYPWWPAQVTADIGNDEDQENKDKSVFVKFFNEDGLEKIRLPSKIKPFDCPEKESFKSSGLSIKNKDWKKLFVQALNMANIIVGNEITEQDTLPNLFGETKNMNGHIESVLCCNNLSGSYDSGKNSNICKGSEDRCDRKLDKRSVFGSREIESSPTNQEKMCSLSSDKIRSPSQSNYLKFKSYSLKQRVDWRNDKDIENNTVYEDTQQNVVNGAKTNSSNKNVDIKLNYKKRKLKFDEDYNGNIEQVLKKTVVDNSDLPDLTKTSTPKITTQKNKTSHLKMNIVKTFTKLSQKKDKRKPKRRKELKSKTKLPDSVVERETAITPKSLKWRDSFELPTPSLSQSDTCATFLTNSSFDHNLEKNTCDSSSDSDTELPEGLSPIIGEIPISENDIVWLRWKKFPAWPAFVRHIYRKKRRIHKLSLVFIEGYTNMPKRLRVSYRSKCIVPFVDKQKDQFIEEGENIDDPEMRQRFKEACEKAENFLYRKALVSLNGEDFSFFGESDEEEIESDTNENDPQVNLSDADKRLSDSDEIESNRSMSPVFRPDEPTAQEKERLRKMTAKQEKLVEYIKSEEMKKYLLDIFYEKKKSELHDTYFHGTVKEKNSLRYAGFGPIYNEDQEEEIVNVTMKWLYELPKKDIPDISYILDVWIPEAIVYALIKVKCYNRTRAWTQFRKGTYMIKAEKERQHHSMMEFIGYTEEEKRDALEKSQRRMETFKFKHGLQ